MAAGTAGGGWRIIKTLGHKMVHLQPVNGFAAESTSAAIIGMRVALRHPRFNDAQHLGRRSWASARPNDLAR